MSTRRRHVDYQWRLREVMADHGLWKTTELGPLLAQRGVELSAAQTYRLVTGRPERLSLHTLAALCDIFDCTPAELIDTTVTTGPAKTPTAKKKPSGRRPRRARITKDQT
jgi:DNA-binding Xre family transcriptional regulator